ncbi:hypothetical protein H696_01027 [Fonticula alba]|uniref:Dynactin subunit 5 n=1 Tax=Fonticula alba TaxID=691883 RepID=A0A058ZB35_FONAL|nr:hypothetical protein H696_01027 [Fonticula alba]KCV71609.1 hypothetical protein H696_01027 [Fonticula alba]|eukprot:XP_009493187.1 hypothetical protein H696_01027 [Fonticula alba]
MSTGAPDHQLALSLSQSAVEPVPRPFAPNSFILTRDGARVSRQASFYGSQNLILAGQAVIEEGAILRSDLRRIRTRAAAPPAGDQASGQPQQPQMPRYSQSFGVGVIVESGAVVRPPGKITGGGTIFDYYPQEIGPHVLIGAGAVVEASLIDSRARIGAGAVVGRFATVHADAVVCPGAVVPPYSSVPPGAVVAGNPATVVAHQRPGLHSAAEVSERNQDDIYRSYVAVAGLGVAPVPGSTPAGSASASSSSASLTSARTQ